MARSHRRLRSFRIQGGSRNGFRAIFTCGRTITSSTTEPGRYNSEKASPTRRAIRALGNRSLSARKRGSIKTRFPSRLSCRTTRISLHSSGCKPSTFGERSPNRAIDKNPFLPNCSMLLKSDCKITRALKERFHLNNS